MGGSKLIESISKRLTNFFVRNGLIKEYDSEIYSYGFEMFVSEIISWLIIIPIAIISGEFLESMAFVFSFIIFRTFGGGYHANTHYGCIISFTFIYLIGLFVGKTISTGISFYLIGACLTAAGFCFGYLLLQTIRTNRLTKMILSVFAKKQGCYT